MVQVSPPLISIKLRFAFIKYFKKFSIDISIFEIIWKHVAAKKEIKTRPILI